MEFEKIPLEEFCAENPFHLFDQGVIALAEGSKEENVACITLGWGGIGWLFGEPMATVYIHRSRYSEHVFDEAERFAVCFFDKEYDDVINRYYGSLSSRDIDKFHEGALSPDYLDEVPVFKEASRILICEKATKAYLSADNVYNHPRIQNWYANDGGHTVFNGKVLAAYRKKSS